MPIDPDALTSTTLPNSLTELFTDRDSERQVLADALTTHAARLAAGELGTGIERLNLLTFVGIGGVGKTQLSERMERWVRGHLALGDHWARVPDGVRARPVVTARIDLHSGQGQFDVISALIAIRTALGSLRPRWVAFDLAFAAYWNAAHPNEAVPSVDKDDSFASSVAGFLTDLAGDLGAMNIVATTASAVIGQSLKHLRTRRDLKAAHDIHPGFERILSECLERPSTTQPCLELATSLVGLLALEMDRLERDAQPLVVVFVDTMERLSGDPRRYGERLLNQLVFAFPQALFVGTGRDRLTWADPVRTDLHRSGPPVWPGLVAGSTLTPRQHQLGNLSHRDASLLMTRVRHAESLPLRDDAIAELVESSRGWPLYLSLGIDLARIVRHNGGPSLEVKDVRGSFRQLVLRVMEDLPADERLCLRAACLLPFFNEGLVAAGADTEYGAAERLAARGLVTPNRSVRYPYRVHDEVREVIRHAGAHVEGGWAEGDWAAAAQRELALVERAWELALASGDDTASIDHVVLALHVFAQTGVEPSWLAIALSRVASLTAVATRMPLTCTTVLAQDYVDFVQARSRQPDPLSADATLKRLASSASAPIAVQAGRHYAYSLRENGDWDGATRILEGLVAVARPELHLLQCAITAVLARRFPEAERRAALLEPEPAERVRTYIAFAHGTFDRWEAAQRLLLKHQESQGRLREAHETRSNILRRAVWMRDVSPADLQDELDACEAIGHRVGTKDSLAGLAMLAVGDVDRLRQITDEIQKREDLSTLDPVSTRVAEARALDAFLRDDIDAARSIRDYVNRRRGPRGRFWIPTEVLLMHLGTPPRETTPTDWLEPYDVVRDRFLRAARQIGARVASA